ncbi:TonB-dependent receptor [Paraferrimonas sp. SM1919]|uniref:TonB-dependent receptor n=1 Tax=Paraferrimonas sp. SM1919 TaxID=2662263 RepID=UPI0013D8B2CD|nr:TonB-dependent receptor [Paraferrimonas sp. SM1919]
MLGFTLAPYHFDQNYDNWGYYIGFARGKTEEVKNLGQHQSGESQHYRYRFGLSYSLTNNISIYGGAISDTRELDIKTRIAPFMVDASPIEVSKNDKDTQWGGEIGARIALDFGLAVSIGYNSISNGVIGGIGFRF